MTVNAIMQDRWRKRPSNLILRSKRKLSISGLTTAFQNKANSSPVASFAKNHSFKLFLSSASKKQPNTPWVDLSSKLASNGKLTSDEHKCLKNNLCLYYGVGDHKLDFCFKKQTMVTPKGHSTSATADPLAAASKKPSKK